ncbi:MAG: serine/threonine-protein kinase, partial [Planctomycetota bacterium]
MADDSSLHNVALERGWISREQAESGQPLEEILTPDQLEELRSGHDLATQILSKGMLSGEDLVDETPEKFGRYRIVRKLGEGGSGRVYLAHDPDLGRDVAIKILDRAAAEHLERFRREMEILAALKHPNIVTIHDAGTQEGRPYFAMEYVGEKSLQGADLDLRGKVRIMEEVARACHAAHEKGIIHRDLKPANILLGERPVVADFGVAK